MKNETSYFFIIFSLFVIGSIVFYGLFFPSDGKTYNTNGIFLNNSKILMSKVKAIGVLDSNNYGYVTFYIYLIPKNKFFNSSDILIDFNDVSLGNTFQDYLKNIVQCINNKTHGKLKNYTILIKAESKFKDVDGGSGSVMLAIGILSALYNKKLSNDFIATGTINPDCSVGSVLGVKEKLIGAESLGYKKFYVPYSNYEMIKDTINKTKIKVIPMKTLDDIIKGELK